MKHILKILLPVVLGLCLAGCGNTEANNNASVSESSVNAETLNEQTSDAKEDYTSDTTQFETEEKSIRLFINDTEIPVTWEDNDSVKELMDEAKKAEIVVSMSMYSDNEQVGPLGHL